MTIAILTATKHEFEAVASLLGNSGTTSRDGKGNLKGRTPAFQGKMHEVTLANASYLIQGASSDASTIIKDYPDITFVIFVGCGGGNPKKVGIGDVVYSKSVVDMSYQTVHPDGDVENRGQPIPLIGDVIKHANTASTVSASEDSQWKKTVRLLVTRLRQEHPDVWEGLCQKHFPEVRLGTIGTSNKRVDNAKYRDDLVDQYHIDVIDMEGAAVAFVCYRLLTEWLVVRGISDFADGKTEDEVLMPYAAAAAAAFVGELLAGITPEGASNVRTRKHIVRSSPPSPPKDKHTPTADQKGTAQDLDKPVPAERQRTSPSVHRNNRLLQFLESARSKGLHTDAQQFTRELLRVSQLETEERMNNEPIVSWTDSVWKPRYDVMYPQCYIDPIVTTSRGEDAEASDGHLSFSQPLQEGVLRNLASTDHAYYLLLGESGIGKSTTLLNLYQGFLEEHCSKDHYAKDRCCAILLRARDIAATRTDISMPMKDSIGADRLGMLCRIWDTYFKVLAGPEVDVRHINGKLWVACRGVSFPTNLLNTKTVAFVDAIDEVDEKTARQIIRLVQSVPHVLSSRTEFFQRTASLSYEFGATQVYYLMEWSREHVLSFVRKFLECNSEHFPGEFPLVKVEEINALFESLAIEDSILVKPLFVVMFMIIAQQSDNANLLNVSDITSSPNKLYEHFLQCWFDKETARDSSRFRTEFEAIQQGASAGGAVVLDVYRNILEYAAWCLFYQKHGVIAGIPWPLQSSEELIANNFRKLAPWQVPYWGGEVSNDIVKLAETGDIKSILDIDNGTKRLVKFIHESIGDFLVASSFVRELSKSHFNEQVLANYYPTEITEFINEALLECDDMVFDSVICNLKSVLARPISPVENNEFNTRVKNWALYFLSRALFARSGTSQREEDLDVFRSMVEVAAHPWLRRTAYIGLIVLGDKAYETRYLRELAGNQLEQEYNIGDMLRYYGDIVFEATMQPDDIRLKRESMRSQGWRRCYTKLIRCFGSRNAKDRQLIGFRAITFLTMLYSLDVSFLTKSREQVELEARHLVDENMGLGTWDKLLQSYEITGRHTPVGEIRSKTCG